MRKIFIILNILALSGVVYAQGVVNEPIPSADMAAPPKKSSQRRDTWGELEKIRKSVWDSFNQDRGEMDEEELLELKSMIEKGIEALGGFGKTVKQKSRIGKEVARTIKQWRRELKNIEQQIIEIASEDYRDKLEDVREEVNDAHRMDSYDEASAKAKRDKFIGLKNKLMTFEQEVGQDKQFVREIRQQIRDIDEHALKYLNNDLERYQQEKNGELSAFLMRQLLLGQIVNRNKAPCR